MTDKEYQKKYHKEYYQKNKETLKEKHKKYSLENKEKVDEKRKEYTELNKDKLKEQRKDFYKTLTRDERKNRDLKSKYNITVDTYKTMLEAQQHSCACCGITVKELTLIYPNSFHNSLVVDHCHEKNKVRDLLCCKCNTLVGYIEKRKEILPKVYEYIEKHK